MEKYLVGGAVRDHLLGVQPNDHDWVLVGATPADVQNLIDSGYQIVGNDFPVFLHPVSGEEYALARKERKVGHGYNGFEMDTEGVTIEEDLGRRDFTINSMAIRVDSEVLTYFDVNAVIDPFNGRDDIKNRVIRHTTYAFVEDPLRALRAARFAARMEFTIHLQTRALIMEMAKSGELEHLTHERVWLELQKGLMGPNPSVFMYLLYSLGIVKHCGPLRDLLPSAFDRSVHKVCSHLRFLKQDDRFELGIGAIATNCELPAITSRAKKAHANFKLLLDHALELQYTLEPEKLVDIVVKIGGLRQGNMFDDALECVKLHYTWDANYVIELLNMVRDCMLGVNAQLFPTIHGRELGAALTQERVRRVANLLVQ